MAKRIGEIEEDVIIAGGIVIGGYFLVRSLLPDLLPDVGVSDADRQVLDQAQTEGLFNASSELGQDWGVAHFDWSHFDTSDDYLISEWNDFIHGNLSPSDQLYNVFVIYYDLYKALFGHLISGNQDQANAALNKITNKWQLGVIAQIFSAVNSGTDFWSVLRRGTFPMVYGLNGADLAKQVERINNLPD